MVNTYNLAVEQFVDHDKNYDADPETNRNTVNSDAPSVNSNTSTALGQIQQKRQQLGQILNHSTVQKFVIALITLNAIAMGVGTYDFVTENESASDIFDTVDKVFLIIFTVELCLQFVYEGLYLFKNGWLTFDFLIIVISWASEGFAVIRTLRILRVTRLINR